MYILTNTHIVHIHESEHLTRNHEPVSPDHDTTTICTYSQTNMSITRIYTYSNTWHPPMESTPPDSYNTKAFTHSHKRTCKYHTHKSRTTWHKTMESTPPDSDTTRWCAPACLSGKCSKRNSWTHLYLCVQIHTFMTGFTTRWCAPSCLSHRCTTRNSYTHSCVCAPVYKVVIVCMGLLQGDALICARRIWMRASCTCIKAICMCIGSGY
jgi:hypothetical protein